MHPLITGYLLTLIGVFGLLIGSFLNVVIYRLPRGEGLGGRSACPTCGHQIAGYDNIPVVSWLLLRGSCRNCDSPISRRYPLVEAGHALLWLAIAVTVGPASPLLGLLLPLASLTLALAVIDWDTMRLPNPLTLATAVLTGTALVLLASTQMDWSRLGRALAGALLLGGFYLLLFIATRGRGLGLGDVKLAPSLGAVLAWMGWGSLAIGAVAPYLLFALPGALLMATKKIKRGTAVPFGPLLIAGAWVGIFVGEPLFALYLSTMS